MNIIVKMTVVMLVQKFFFGCCLLLFVFGCRKYNLKQPAFVSFNSEITVANEEAPVKITEGAICVDNIKVIGDRLEGQDIEIEQSQSADILQLNAGNTSLGISMDIPQGDYTNFDIQLDLNENKQPAMELKGTFTMDAVTYPFVVYWRDKINLSFLYDGIISIKKKESYNTQLTFDQNKLMNAVNWEDAKLTDTENGKVLVINAITNEPLFEQITYNLKSALIFNIKE